MSAIYVCLVSQQLLPNYIGILAEQPTLTVLVVSDGMRKEGARLSSLLAGAGFQVEQWDGMPDAGLVTCREAASQIVGELMRENPGFDVVLNLTGGTKIMALGFLEEFRRKVDAAHLRVVYTDTEHGRFEYIAPPREAEAIPNVLDVEGYLAVQGFQVDHCGSNDETWQGEVESRRKLTNYLASNAPRLHPFIGQMNEASQTTLGNNTKQKGGKNINTAHRFPPLAKADAGEELTDAQKRMLQAFNLCIKAGVVQRVEQKGGYFCFASESAARYLGGHWIEEYAWLTLTGLKSAEPHVNDVKAGVVGRWMDGDHGREVSNEFDCLATFGNRLLVIECKTVRFNDSKGAPSVYKLDSLGAAAGGALGKRVLLSALSLDETTQQRAIQGRIEVVAGNQLSNFPKLAAQWIQESVRVQ